MRSRPAALVAVLVAGLMTVLSGATAADGTAFPAQLSLPDGFQPEGIAIGAWPTAYTAVAVPRF